MKPRASAAGLGLTAEGELVVWVRSAAAEGEANRECIQLLAKALRVPKKAVHIIRGRTNRQKQISIDGMTVTEGRAKLKELAGEEK